MIPIYYRERESRSSLLGQAGCLQSTRLNVVGEAKEEDERQLGVMIHKRALPGYAHRDLQFVADLVGQQQTFDRVRIMAKGNIGRCFRQGIRLIQ